jgi:HEAT repeat protein
LLAALARKGEANAHAIIFALGEIGPAAAAAEPRVLEAMDGKDKSLAVIAARTYTLIQTPSSKPQSAGKAVPVLISGLGDSLPETRQTAAEGLAELGSLAGEAVPALEKASHDDVKSVREAAAKALTSVR